MSKDKAREEWRDIALRMADNMAEHMGQAMQPHTVEDRAHHLRLANGWRQQYELARRKMGEQS